MGLQGVTTAQPFGAFLGGDGLPVALGVAAERRRITRPALAVPQAQRQSLQREGQEAVLHQTEELVGAAADQAQALRGGTLTVIEAGGVGERQHRGMDGRTLPHALHVRSQQIARRERGVIQKAIGGAGLASAAGGFGNRGLRLPRQRFRQPGQASAQPLIAERCVGIFAHDRDAEKLLHP